MTEQAHLNHETKMTEAHLEEIAGGIQNLFIGGDAGVIVDNSVNDSFNSATVTQVDASRHVTDSFNTSVSSYRSGYYWPF